jgi:hypothetical protein
MPADFRRLADLFFLGFAIFVAGILILRVVPLREYITRLSRPARTPPLPYDLSFVFVLPERRERVTR